MRHRVLLIPMLAALLALGGCGSLRLYSETRDEQGKAAKEAWAKVDLAGIITTERENLRKLLELELETQDQLAAGIRDHELRYIVGAERLDEALVGPIDQRLMNLIGNPAVFADAVEARARIRRVNRSIAIAGDEFTMKNLKPPTCKDLAGDATPAAISSAIAAADETSRKELERSLQQMRKHCAEDAGDDLARVFKPLGGKMQEAVEQFVADSDALQQAADASKVQQAKVAKAVADYKKVVAAGTADATARADVQAAAKKVDDEIAALIGLGDAFSIKFASEQRLAAIDEFFTAVAGTKPGADPPEDVNDAAAALIVVPDLIDKARTALADAKKPLAMPLLLRRDHEQLKLEAANREIAIRKSMISISRELMDAIYAQAFQLWLASGEISQDGSPDPVTNKATANVAQWNGKSVLDAFSKGSADEKEALYAAATRYLDAIGRLDAQRYKLEYRRIAASHELSLAYSEVNAKQWQSLIGITVQQLAEFSAGGIKSQQITDLLNSAALIWIGNGTNK